MSRNNQSSYDNHVFDLKRGHQNNDLPLFCFFQTLFIIHYDLSCISQQIKSYINQWSETFF